jgi:hypothetical protein
VKRERERERRGREREREKGREREREREGEREREREREGEREKKNWNSIAPGSLAIKLVMATIIKLECFFKFGPFLASFSDLFYIIFLHNSILSFNHLSFGHPAISMPLMISSTMELSNLQS